MLTLCCTAAQVVAISPLTGAPLGRLFLLFCLTRWTVSADALPFSYLQGPAWARYNQRFASASARPT